MNQENQNQEENQEEEENKADYEYSTTPGSEKLEKYKEIYGKESTKEVLEDPYILANEWEIMKYTISYEIKNVVGQKVKVWGNNLGRNQEGKTLKMNYKDVLDKITIYADFKLYVYINEQQNNITIKRTDHDSQTLSQANTFIINPQ